MSDESNIFNTLEIRPWEVPRLLNSKPMIHAPCHGTSFPMGLNWLNFGPSGNIRIKPYALANPNGATVHLDASGDTVLYSAGCTWLNVCKNDRDFQFGTFSTAGQENSHPSWSAQITFEKPYTSVPKVVVWFREFDLDKAHTWRLKAFAENVTTTGFTLKLCTWNSTRVYKATVTWIAHPSNRPNITSGNFSTNEFRTWRTPQLENKKLIAFDRDFKRPPRVYAGLNLFDIERGANLRLKVLVKDLTAQGMALHLDSWCDTTHYSSGADYIAVEDH